MGLFSHEGKFVTSGNLAFVFLLLIFRPVIPTCPLQMSFSFVDLPFVLGPKRAFKVC